MLDLSSRNRLLNFKFSERSRTQVRLVDELPDQVFEKLEKGTALTITLLPEPPQHPTLDPTSVLGVVAYGDSLHLTGRMIQADGIVWYEAIAPDLYSSPDAGAQNRLEASQTGWIASYFVQSHV